MSKRLNIHTSVDEIKELRLKEYELSWYPHRVDFTKDGFFRLYTNATDAQKKSFAEKNPFIGKYQFKFDDTHDGGLWVRIRPLPVKSVIAVQDEPYCYPECWDATPIKDMVFIYDKIITHGGYSSKEQVATWMRDVAPHIRNYHFEDTGYKTGSYNVNIAITERSEEEKIAYDTAKTLAAALAVGVEESPVEELKAGDIVKAELKPWKNEGAMKAGYDYEESIAVKPATGNYCLVVEDEEADDVNLPIEVHYNKTDDEIQNLATDLLKNYNAAAGIGDEGGRVSIRELGKEIAAVTCATEVVHKTSWFRSAEHKTDAESAPGISEDAPKPNGADKEYAEKEAAAQAYTGGF